VYAVRRFLVKVYLAAIHCRPLAEGRVSTVKRPPLVALVTALAAIGLVAAGLAWLLDVPTPPPGASRAERLYVGVCATCHGLDGRGSWRAALFLIRPGDLGERARMSRDSDAYLFEIIKNGGAPFGRPGMPSFGYLSDADIEALVHYVRGLAARRPAAANDALGARLRATGYRSFSILRRTIPASRDLTASRTASPGSTRAASRIAGSAAMAISSMGAIPSALIAS
jgi:mono/diheme cytochrome c family protein